MTYKPNTSWKKTASLKLALTRFTVMIWGKGAMLCAMSFDMKGWKSMFLEVICRVAFWRISIGKQQGGFFGQWIADIRERFFLFPLFLSWTANTSFEFRCMLSSANFFYFSPHVLYRRGDVPRLQPWCPLVTIRSNTTTSDLQARGHGHSPGELYV